MEKIINDLKEKVIEYLVKLDNLDEPYIIKGDKVLTKNQIIYEIFNDTKTGMDFINNLVILSLDLLTRGKETTPEFKKT